LKIDTTGHVEKQLQLIQEFGERGALLIKQLLTFSRQQVVQPVPLNVNNLVTGMLKMLCRLIGENIRLTFQRKEKIQPINADPGQIEQILMNLVVNARDAINTDDELQTGGEIHIETRMIKLTNEPILISSGIRAGVYVQLSVSDTGRGMDQETQTRIFEPFFTTKPLGKGTGLGLSTVYGIVKNCKGAIDIESEPHKGACIKVLFPAMSNAEGTELEKNLSNMESSGQHARGIPLRIMLLEDDDSVRRSIQFALQKMGHSVMAYSDPIEAEKKFHEVSETLDLLVSDVIMPGCDGPEFYSRLLKHSPILKVLFISGYADHHIPRKLVHNRQTHFLQKPFTMKQLGKAIHQLIHGRKEEKKKNADLQEEMRMAV
jgi:CheY-like chemotaxis protein